MTTGTVLEDPSVVGGGSKTSLFQPPTTGGFSFGEGTVNRFKKYIPPTPPNQNECWEWSGCFAGNNYGSFWDGVRRVNAHRFSYRLFVGEIPEGLLVLHKCDNRRCVNPFHLFVGTYKDNAQDCISKGRFCFNSNMFQSGVSKPEITGEKNGRSKVNSTQVADIRKLRSSGLSLRKLSERFSVSKGCICAIISGRNWKHIPL